MSKSGLRLTLNNLENTRKTLGRLTRAYDDGRITDAELKVFTYALNTMLSFFKEEKGDEIEKRLEKIESALRSQKRQHSSFVATLEGEG